MEPFETRGFSDQLNIATPEHVELAFPVAGMGSRAVALILDTLIIWAGYIVLFIVAALLISSYEASGHHPAADKAMDNGEAWAIAILLIIFFGLQVGYFALLEGLWHGQTVGKRVMKLRVIKESGRQITFFEALARNLIRIIDSLPQFYLVGLISMACNKQNKRLGDFAAGTVVIHERVDDQPMLLRPTTLLAPEAVPLSPWSSPAVSENAMFPADSIARLDSNDLRVIETFFARALDLAPETRTEMAGRIATQMAAKMGVALPAVNPERVLEAIAHSMRSGAARF